MVRDIELPFNHHTRMSRCQLKFLLYVLTKQNGDFKPKWWPDNIPYEHPISNSFSISKDSLIDLFKSYYKYKGDCDWLRAVLFFILYMDNLTKETDFTSIDISGKILHKGIEFDILPVTDTGNKNKNTARLLNISSTVVDHFKNTKFEYNKISGTNTDYIRDLTNIDKTENNKDIKLCIKESHIKQMMPVASVQLYDVVRYNTVHTKEDFLLKLNLMKTDVLSKLNLLKFRKRLRNTSRDSIKSASEFEKDLIKFKSKPNKEVLKEQSKRKEKKKLKEKDKVESPNTVTEYMDVENLPLPLNEIIDVDGDMNKENENFVNSSKENITTAVNTISSPKTSIPFQQQDNKIRDKTDSVIIDLTLDDTPTKVKKGTNNLYQFLNMSPTISPKPEKKMKESSPKNLKRLNRHSMPLMNQKNIKSYFNPIPMKLTPEFIAKKLDELKKVCKPCFVRLDFVKNLKPIRSYTEESVDEMKERIETLPLPTVIEEVATSIIDLTNDDDIFESSVNEKECDDTITILEDESDNIENDINSSTVEAKDSVNQKPKNDLKIQNKAMKKKKVIIKVKWPSKRITL